MTLPSRSIAVALSFLLATAAAAEVPKPPDNVSRYKTAVYQMRSGNIRVKDDPKNREAIKLVAQHLAFTICTPPYNGEPEPGKAPIGVSKTMSEIMSDAASLSDIYSGTTAKPGQEQIEFADEFGKAIAEASATVLGQSKKPIERINAVRLMSIAARIPAPSLFDPLVAVVNDAKVSDAEKLYAFQGLKNLLEQSDVNDPTRHIIGGTAGNPKLAEVGKALEAYVMQKRTPKDEKEVAVIQFVRREAIAALARFKDGVIRKPNRELLFRPAWTMIRVMEMYPDVSRTFPLYFSPDVTIQERMEAAIGLASMKIDPDMNLDVAAPSMAGVLLWAAREANVDHERSSGSKTETAVQWKLTGARWSYALSVWRQNAKSVPIREVANAGIALLTVLEKEGASGRTAAGFQDVNTWLQNNPPKAWAEMKPAIVFKDDPNSVIPFPREARADPKLTTPAVPKPGDPKKDDPKKAPDPKKVADPKKGTPPPPPPAKGPTPPGKKPQ